VKTAEVGDLSILIVIMTIGLYTINIIFFTILFLGMGWGRWVGLSGVGISWLRRGEGWGQGAGAGGERVQKVLREDSCIRTYLVKADFLSRRSASCHVARCCVASLRM